MRGGPSNEYAVSLASGASVLGALNHEELAPRYRGVDILVDQTGRWHLKGREINPQDLKHHVDVIWNALHGYYGEDGQIQELLDSLHIPYTGSTRIASAIGINKKITKDIVKKSGITVARDYLVRDPRELGEEISSAYLNSEVRKIFEKLSPPWVVKPLSGGSSIGVSIVITQGELYEALRKLSEYPGDILIEEYVIGREATVGVLDEFRGKNLYSFPPIEIRVPEGRFFDYQMKYEGEALEISPGNFSNFEKLELEEAAQRVHKLLGLRHYSRSDFVVTPRGIYFIEVNTHPGLTNQSLLPKSLETVGAKFHHFIDHILHLALKK